MRSCTGTNSTVGLPDDIIISFLTPGNKLAKAIEAASRYHADLKANFHDFLELDESEQVGKIQAGFTNFYDISTVNPYVTLAAAGPWIITTKGAVIYDCGGYGMLGLGHAPEIVLTAMNQPHVMANIMTANVSQMQFTDRLEQEVGQKRGN